MLASKSRWPWEPAPISRASALIGVAGFIGLVLLVGTMDYQDRRGLQVENAKLRSAFAVMVEKTRWSCYLDEGERVICAVKDGAISRLSLADDDQVVTAKAVSAPIGKKKRRRQ